MKHHFKNILLILLLLLSGCTLLKEAKQTPNEIARNQAITILNSVISKDSDMLKSLLTPSVQESPEVDEQIETFLNFINGNVISYSKPRGSLSSQKKRSGKIVQEFLSGRTINIETDSENKYAIYHHAINISAEMPDEIGVYNITIVDVTPYDSEQEYPEYKNAIIGKPLFSE